jgi:sugar lactone lactonase YvrE
MGTWVIRMCVTGSHGTLFGVTKGLSIWAVSMLAFVLVGTILMTPARADLMVADWSAGTIYAYQSDGSRSTFASGLSAPSGLALDGYGNLYEADESSGTVYKFTPSGARSVFASGLGLPCGIAIDHNGNVFVSVLRADNIPNNMKVYKFTPDGGRSVFATSFIFPLGMTVDASDNLYVADFNRIVKITPGGSSSVFAGASSGAINIVVSPLGDFYVSTDYAPIYKYTPSGTRSLFASVPGKSSGMAFDTAGNLFVADRGTGCGNIYMFTPDGVRTTFATGLVNPEIGMVFVPEPSSVMFLAYGGFWFISRRRRPKSIPRRSARANIDVVRFDPASTVN